MCSRRFEENTTTSLSTRFHLGVPQLGVNTDLKKERKIALALGNIVCKLSNIVIIKINDVTCKFQDPRFNT